MTDRNSNRSPPSSLPTWCTRAPHSVLTFYYPRSCHGWMETVQLSTLDVLRATHTAIRETSNDRGPRFVARRLQFVICLYNAAPARRCVGGVKASPQATTCCEKHGVARTSSFRGSIGKREREWYGFVVWSKFIIIVEFIPFDSIFEDTFKNVSLLIVKKFEYENRMVV